MSELSLSELKKLIGDERFDAACVWAWRTAGSEGKSQSREQWPDDLEQVPHDLADLWYGSDAPLQRRLDEAFALYRLMPCYANTMYIRHFFDEFDAGLRAHFWSEYRKLFASPKHELFGPVAYSLWCDYFEDRETVGEAWREMTAGLEEGLTRARLMEVCGPVPSRLKAPLLTASASNRGQHPAVFKALWASAFDVYGDIDATDGARLLDELRLGHGDPDVVELRGRLTGSEQP